MWLRAGAELMETLGHWARCLPRGLRDAPGCARALLVARWPQDALIAERRPAHGVTAATVPPLAVPCPQSFGVTGGEVAFTAGATGRRSPRPRGARRRRGAMGPHAAAAHTAAFVRALGAATLPARLSGHTSSLPTAEQSQEPPGYLFCSGSISLLLSHNALCTHLWAA